MSGPKSYGRRRPVAADHGRGTRSLSGAGALGRGCGDGPADRLLSRLDLVREVPAGRGVARQWSARCPAHDDRRPSLRVGEKADGTVLIHCHAGCEAGDVLAAVGLSLADLYPNGPVAARQVQPHRRTRQDALKTLSHESIVVRLCAIMLSEGQPVDRDRLGLADRRIQAALRELGLSPPSLRPSRSPTSSPPPKEAEP